MVNNATFLLFFTCTVFGILSIVTLLGNGLIIIVNGHQWLQNKKMVPCDFLLFILSTSRFLLQIISGVNYVMHFISPESYHEENIVFILMFFTTSSFWSATWLNVFYCVKVANFENFLFLWLKPRINVLMPRLLGGSIIGSFAFTLPSGLHYSKHKMWSNLSGNLPGSTNQSEACNNFFIVFLPQQLFLTCLNFAINVTASILLLRSLWSHTRNLKKSGIATKDLSSQVHVNIMKLLLFSLFFYLLYFIGMMISTSQVVNVGLNEQLVSEILQATFPSAHSIILILTNPKLKKAATTVLKIRRQTA